MKKDDINKWIQKYQPAMKKTGDQVAKAMKAAEKDLSKMYRVAQAHWEMQMKNLKKEKLYHELGKYVASELMKDKLTVANLEKYKKRLVKLNSEGVQVKKKIARISKISKSKKTTETKKSAKK